MDSPAPAPGSPRGRGHAQSILLICFCICFSIDAAKAQNGYLPLSREVERQFAPRLHARTTDLHTSIRPYRLREVLPLVEEDTLIGSALPVLDRWGGWENGRKFRWGPLVDASVGYGSDDEEPLIYKGGAGLWADLDVGDRLNFHVDGQAWSQRFPNYMRQWVLATQVTPGEGYAYGDAPDFYHYDWNAHVSWDPGKFFNLTLGRGRNFFGEGYRSLMLSAEAQGYPFLRITTNVWKVKYVNLFTMMNDIRGADGDPARFQKKYSATHYLSWNALSWLNFSIFETIVFDPGTDEYPRGFDMNYLNPVIFYRPVEFNVGSPDNALLGASLNVKVGKGTTIYSQFVLDEFLWTHVRNGTGWYGNKQSVQLGAVAYDAFQIPGATLRGEWNYIRPFMYSHNNNIQNLAHFGQPLAHPYGSNVHELILHADLERDRMLYGVRLSMAWMGADSVNSYGNNIFRPESERPRWGSNNNPVNYGYYHGHYWGTDLLHAELRAGFLMDRHTGTRLEASYLFRSRGSEVADTRMDHVFRLGIMCYFRDRNVEQEVRYHLH